MLVNVSLVRCLWVGWRTEGIAAVPGYPLDQGQDWTKGLGGELVGADAGPGVNQPDDGRVGPARRGRWSNSSAVIGSRVVAALAHDPDRPEFDDVAVLMVLPSAAIWDRDRHPGSEQVNLVAAMLLAEGFALVSSFDPAALLALPAPGGWHFLLDEVHDRVRITGREGVLYHGTFGIAQAPWGWLDTARRQQELPVLVATITDAMNTADDAVAGPDGVPRRMLESARLAGNTVGALVSVVKWAPISARWR